MTSLGNKQEVLLISMPWAARNYTPIRLGVLKAGLAKEGINCRTENLFLRFSDLIDAELYDKISMSSYPLLGEWFFNRELVDRPGTDYLEFLAEGIRSQVKLFGEADPIINEFVSNPKYVDTITHIRNCIALQFIDDEVERLSVESYPVVGFSCVVNQLMPSLVFAKKWKQRHPDSLIVFGGASVEGEMGEECLRAFPWVDVTVDGEGDATLPELVRFWCSNPSGDAWKSCAPKGIFAKVDDEVVYIGRREPIQNLDDVSVPDYSDFFASVSALRNSAPPNVFLQFESSRGCWWGQKSNCIFCGLNGKNISYRSKSASRIFGEMLTLSGTYASSQLYAVDTVCGPAMFREVLGKIIESEFDLSLFLEVHPTLKQEYLEQMSKAGVHLIQPGIESFSTEILRYMRKGTDAIHTIRFLRWCRELGIDAKYNILWGFPDESAKTYQSMTTLMASLFHLSPPNYPPCRIMFQRFSPLSTEVAAKHHWTLEPLEDYSIVFPASVDFGKLASSFEHPLPYPLPGGPDYVPPLARVMKEWNNRFSSPYRPMLVYSTGPGFVEMFDTRFADEPKEFVLKGLAAAVLTYCEDIREKNSIIDHCKSLWGDAYDEHDVETILETLIENHLLFEEDDQYLTLAIKRKLLKDEIYFASQIASTQRS